LIKVKNVRAGIVIISDAGLKLSPGEVVELLELTPQVSTAINAGMLATVEPQAQAETKSEAKSETKPKAKVPARTSGQKVEPKVAAEATATPPAAADSADDSATEGTDGSS
jgi:hypothetical protein